MLDVQYRMHPAIAAFPAVASYNGKLRSGVSGAMRKAPQGIAWPLPEAPVTFLPVEGKEKSEGTSWFNETEVEAVEALLGSALAWNDIAPTEIGVITPYAAQAVMEGRDFSLRRSRRKRAIMAIRQSNPKLSVYIKVYSELMN